MHLKNKHFFQQVKAKIIDLGIDFYILGGDMNCIPTLTPASLNQSLGNLDTFCMNSLPNYQNCIELLKEISRIIGMVGKGNLYFRMELFTKASG